jgi:predicted nucleotidyltransferase component of viral defense system
MNNNIEKSIRQRLNNLAKQKGIPVHELTTNFLIERMLVRVVNNKTLFDKLVFKGGYVAVKIYSSSRHTRDLDAVLEKGNIKQIVELVKKTVSTDLNDGTWFLFKEEIDLETQNEYGGIRLVFRAGIGQVTKGLKKAQLVNLDIGYGDPITPEPIKIKTASILEGDEISWRIYPIETSVAEKLHAIVARQSFNSRSKDIFDLYILLPQCNIKTLKNAITATFEYRKETVPSSFSSLLKTIDTSILESGWKKAVVSLGGDQDFKKTFHSVIEMCENAIDKSK